MRQEFTGDFMKDNCGCYSVERLVSCSFMRHDIITLYDIIESEIPLRDKFWFVCKKLATKRENQQIAIAVAEIALPLYEARYPDNGASRACIEAAKLFLAGSITLDELQVKRKAYASAAYAAAAAYASAAYAAAAAYASAAADVEVELHNYLRTFIGK